MATGLIEIMQKAAKGVQDTQVQADVVFGTVISESPLEIKLDNNITLSSEHNQIKLVRNVTEHEIEVTPLEWYTEDASGGAGEAAYAAHKHLITGKKKIRIHNQLKSGEKVVLIKMAGGQTYLVIDRQGEI